VTPALQPPAAAPTPGPVPGASALPAVVADPVGPLSRRVEVALDAVVPGAWREAVAVRLSLVPGSRSRAWTDGEIEISEFHAAGPWDRLLAVVAHEFGHQIAFRHGSGAYLGAAPEGWAEVGPRPEERWADCVAGALTGVPLRAEGREPCVGAPLETAASILAAGPR
jgi:hypothetical protein